MSASKNKARDKNATIHNNTEKSNLGGYCRAFPITTRVKRDQLRDGCSNNNSLRNNNPLSAPEADRPLGNIFLPEASTVASSPWVWILGAWAEAS